MRSPLGARVVVGGVWSWLSGSPSAPFLTLPITVNASCNWALSSGGDLEGYDSPTASVTFGNMGNGALSFSVCGGSLGTLTTASGAGTFTYPMSLAAHLCNGLENVYPLRVTNTSSGYTAYAPTLYYYNYD